MATLRDLGLTVNTDDGRANILADQDIAAGMGSLRRGWESGRIGTELNPLRTKALDAKIAGDAARQAELDAQVSALEQRQQMFAPRVSDLRDINGVGDGLDWFTGQAGQGAASMLDPVAAAAGLGVVGRVAGAIPHPIAKGIGLAAQAGQFAVPWMMSKQQLTGEFIGEAGHDKELMARTSPQGLRDMAGNYGVVAGGLDSALPGMFGRQITGLSRAGSTVARQSTLGAGAKFGLGVLGEGATEGAQAAGSQYARGLLNPNRDTSGDNWDIVNNFAGGMAGGSPFAGAGALAEAGHNRIDGGVDAVKGKAGEVVDLMNANPAVQEVKEAGKKWWQSGKEAVIDLQAAVADENGNITPSSVAGAAKGAVDMGVEKANRAAATEEFWNAMSGQMPPEMAADASPVGAAQQEAWVKAHDERRATAVMSMLKTMQDDPKAQELLASVNEADPVNRHIALTQAGGYVVDRMEQDSLAEEAGVAKENQGAKLVGALGGLAGRAAMGVGKTALEFGKAALSGAKEGMGRKKNMQVSQAEYDAMPDLPAIDTPYGDWLLRTGRNKTTLAEEALNEVNSTQTGPAKPEAIKLQQAMEKSYRRAQLFGEKLASVTKRNLSTEIGDYMRDVGFEIADLAESWGMTEGAGKPETMAPRMQGKGLELNLSNIANSMRVALGKGAIPVLDQLQSLADPKSVPMFDILRKHLQVGSTPEAREERKVLRATVADQVLMLLPPEQAKMILEDTSDPEVSGPEQLLRSIERMGRGHLSRNQRIAITKAVGGKGVLNEMLQTVGAIAEPETVVGSIVDDRAQSGEENFEQNADDEAGTTDFETRAQEKNVAKGVGGKVYGFHASPNLRTSSERRDPFSATEKLSSNDIAARELLGESTMMRPKLFTKGQKLFGGKSAIEKKVADTRAQLAGDPAYPDHANYDVRSKSAHEVMTDMNMQPGKVLQLFRDYAGEETGAMGQAAAMARFVIVRSMRLDALRKAKLNGEPAPTFAPFKNPALKAAEASYNARFKDMRDGGQLDENVNYARVEFDKIVRAELLENAEMYFKDRFMVVGEKLSNQDADQIALPTILDMHRHGQTLVEQSRVGDAADGSKAVLPKDMADKKLSEANVLMFKTKSGGRSKEFAIPAGDLVNWVRQQRGKTEAADSEDNGGSFSNRSKDDEYLEDLSHGIASLIGSGHVQGMPYKINAKGWQEKFSKGIPESLMLATTTYGAKKFGDEQRRSKQTPKTAAELQTVGNEEYDEEVAADANRNAEFFTPEDRVERELVVDDKKQRASDAGAQLITREHTTDGELTGEVVMPDGKKRIATFVSDGEGGYKMKERVPTRVDVSGEVAADSKTDDPHKTPLDFVGKQKAGEVADERTNQRWLSRQTGASTDMSPGPEPKARAASRAKFRADEIMAVMNKDVESGTEMIAARLRAARAPEYNENKPARGKLTVPGVKGEDQVVGGAHYVAPLAYLANAGRVAQMNLSESEKEMFTDLRKQVAQILLESNLSGMNKLAIARLMSEKPEALTAQNLDARLARIVGGVAEGKALGAKQEKVGPTAEDRIANDNFDGLDTVAKVDKFLKDAYAAWENGSDNRDVQARLNRMFDEGNFASTDLASFYDGLKGGNAELDHDGILAALKSAPEVAGVSRPKGQPTLSGGQRVSELATVIRSMFKGPSFDKVVGIYQTVAEALEAADITLPSAMLSVKSDRLKLEGMFKQWFQTLEVNKIPKDLMNDVMRLVGKKEDMAARGLLVDWARSESARIKEKWSPTLVLPPAPGRTPHSGNYRNSPKKIESEALLETRRKMEKQAAVALARQKRAYDDGALMDPQMLQAMRIYVQNPAAAVTHVADQMLQERQVAMQILARMDVEGISTELDKRTGYIDTPGADWDTVRAELEESGKVIFLSTLEHHYIVEAMDRAMDARLEYVPDMNEQAIAQTIVRLRSEPSSSNFLTEFDKTAKMMDVAEQHEDGTGGVWRKYKQTSKEDKDFRTNVSALTARAYSTWCTSQGAAAHQLQAGDFWVYSDKEGKTQLALRMSGNSVGEIQDQSNTGRVQPEHKDRFVWLVESKLLPEEASRELSDKLREVIERGSSKEARIAERRLDVLLNKPDKTVSEAAQILQLMGHDAAEVGDKIVIRGDFNRAYTFIDHDFGGDVEAQHIPWDVSEFIEHIEGDLVVDPNTGVPLMPNLHKIGGEIKVSGRGIGRHGENLKAALEYAKKQVFDDIEHKKSVLRINGTFDNGRNTAASPYLTNQLAQAQAMVDTFGDRVPDAVPIDVFSNEALRLGGTDILIRSLARQMDKLPPTPGLSPEHKSLWIEEQKSQASLRAMRAERRQAEPMRFDFMDDDIPFSRKADGTIQGFYDPKGKKSYLIADGIAKGEEMGVMLHEVGVHMGMEKMLGAEKYGQLIGQIKKWENGMGLNKQIAQAARARVAESGATGVQADHELLAYFVEEAVKAGIDPTKLGTNALAKWMNQVWEAVKVALSDLGWDTSKLQARDVVALAHGAAQIEMGAKQPAKPNAPTQRGGVGLTGGPHVAKDNVKSRQAQAEISALASTGRLNAQNPAAKVSTQAERDAAVAYAKKVLGPKIKVDFQDITGYSGEFIEATNTIVISTTAAAGTLNTLYHEALHKFFADFVKGNPKVQAMFETLINDPKHLAKLHALLDGYPAAQAQLTSGEERLAYTYQFWKVGLLEVDAKASTWLQKLGKFFRRVAGRVRDSERALELFEAFDAGKMSEPSAAGMVIAKAMAKGTATLKFRRKMDAMFQGLAALTVPSAEILGMSVSPTARKLSTMFFTNPGEEAHGNEETGLLNARRSAAQQYVNTSNRRFEGMSQMDKEQVQEHLQNETPLDKIAYAEHREAVKDIRQLLERFHKYMVDAGMDIGKIENYYPVVWNVDRVMSNKAKFINMLVTKYAAELAPADGDVQKAAERIYASLISKDGIDKHLPAQREDGVLNPFFASQEMRTMPWLKAEDRAEYLEKDMPMTLTRYFNQGVHAAEYRRRFGKNGIKLEKMLATINEELSAAGKEMLRRGEFKDEAARVKWVGRQMRDVVQATGAMEGSLGKDVSPNMRKFNSWMTVYQNVRLLPMALFSSFVDPLALVARGAPFKAAYETFVYSMREVFRNWGDAFRDMPPARQKDEWRQLSELIGASEIAVFQHQVSDLYASTYMTPGAKKINDKMFTFNGMEAWNRGTRIMATKWAVRFLEQHAGLPDKNHSARWLKELGLTPAMITLDDGKLVTTPQQLMALKGITLDEARAQIAPIHEALNRWVEGAVLTPNAAQRPSWGSDPNFATMFHLKQFSYSFHQTILKRAANEFNHGNVAPLAALAAFIPTMIGADIMKGLIQGGGSLPPYMAGMNAGDWVMHATQRAGLHGIGVIGVDAANDWASLGGPAFEQIVDAGRDGFGSKSALNALPLHSLYGQLAQ